MWTNGNVRSQVDHILTHTNSTLFLRHLQCVVPKSFSTDHKIMWFDVVKSHTTTQAPPPRRKEKRQSSARIDPAPLRNDLVKQKFREQLCKQPLPVSFDSIDDQWSKLHHKVQSAAETVLKKPSRYFINRECRKALAKVKKYSFWAGRSGHPKWGYKLLEARQELKRAQNDYEEKEVEGFFKDLLKYPTGERINRTFRYLKRHQKKKTSSRRSTSIRLSDWVVDDVDSPSQIPAPLLESAGEALIAGPTLAEVETIVSRMKNGKTPGVDGLYSEFFKYCDESTVQELHQLLLKVWEQNELPEEWKRVVVVPIPKTKHPKTVGEYRRICLSCTGYKVYATWVLEKLQSITTPLGLHQAAFLNGRSTTDHLHVLQRILKEYWNGGKPLVLMSLDIEKAFDQVSLESLPAILRGKLMFHCILQD